ncbi:hypothetical protein [Paenirhodobacter enshiensis]|uniref:hypothetical protein n=1 Tax=Paenirhodobacter enshiensis TaxID=1105367 RepID=UPI001267E2AC|nr:hypothetical protein [Paenirhodobacter enshiensis]
MERRGKRSWRFGAVRWLCLAWGAAAMAGCAGPPKVEEGSALRIVVLHQPHVRAYAGAVAGLRGCNGMESRHVEGQIYPGRGFAEASLWQSRLGVGRPMLLARFTAISPRETRLDVVSLLAQDRDGAISWLQYWAKGGQACPRLRYSEAPPPV